ncbi:MAG TPA: GNAT family N-acetyltransferase [bacterium]|nr:GNAT family N-acetyltransferase [bacterium]
MLEHTNFRFGFCSVESGQLIGFARVLTDRVYQALILDVNVDRAHRNRDSGTELMPRILDHPELRSVKHFELYCLPELESVL